MHSETCGTPMVYTQSRGLLGVEYEHHASSIQGRDSFWIQGTNRPLRRRSLRLGHHRRLHRSQGSPFPNATAWNAGKGRQALRGNGSTPRCEGYLVNDILNLDDFRQYARRSAR